MDVTIHPCTESDIPAVIELWAETFTKGEPMAVYQGITARVFAEAVAPMVHHVVPQGLSLVVRRNGNLIAFVLCEDFALIPEAPTPDSLKETFALLGQLEHNYLEATFKGRAPAVGELFHCAAGGTLAGNEGLGIGARFFSECLEVARRAGFKRVFVEAAHPATNHIWKKLGAVTISEIEYATFEFEGSRPFSGLTNPRSCTLLELVISSAEASA
mmetsp:Transcript_22956/g.53588  ORF Transcript_22956/g.53588 Transcript_22956/m.53588 type:complete len:215 (-) Transcript_22956:66-710(-)